MLTVEATIDRVYAHRGEVVTGVTGNIVMRGDTVERANISGAFISGQPVNIRMEPRDGGLRELRIGGRDAGAALRAANLYSKVSGGQINFSASLGASGDASLRDGKLVLRDFAVRDEDALSGIDQKGKSKKTGPRRDGMNFSRLTMPFTSDGKFIRIGDTLIRGPDMGATAQGIIRKADGAIDIDGTIIPAYQLNSAIGEIPIVGDIVTGGKGTGDVRALLCPRRHDERAALPGQSGVGHRARHHPQDVLRIWFRRPAAEIAERYGALAGRAGPRAAHGITIDAY